MERKRFSIKAIDKGLLQGAQGVFDSRDPRALQLKDAFDQAALRFTEHVDSKFFKPEPEVEAHAQQVADYKETLDLNPLILGMPHDGYVSGPLMTKAARMVLQQSSLEGFYLTVASTLVDGKQGAAAYMSYQGWRPYMEANGVTPVPVVREKDSHLYTPSEMRKYGEILAGTLGKMFVNNHGFMMFPEGGMDAGRNPTNVLKKNQDLPYTPNNDKLAGIQKVTDSNVINRIVRMLQKNDPFQVWLLSSKNGQMVGNPDTKNVPIGAIGDMLHDKPRIEVILESFPPIPHTELVERIAQAYELHNDRKIVVAALRQKPDMLFDYLAGQVVAPRIDWYRRGYYHTHAAKVLEKAGLTYFDKLSSSEFSLAA